VQKLKAGGRTLEEGVSAGPTKEFDPTWGNGFMDFKSFIGIVYRTL
jgi:hypothetical protein